MSTLVKPTALIKLVCVVVATTTLQGCAQRCRNLPAYQNITNTTYAAYQDSVTANSCVKNHLINGQFSRSMCEADSNCRWGWKSKTNCPFKHLHLKGQIVSFFSKYILLRFQKSSLIIMSNYIVCIRHGDVRHRHPL